MSEELNAEISDVLGFEPGGLEGGGPEEKASSEPEVKPEPEAPPEAKPEPEYKSAEEVLAEAMGKKAETPPWAAKPAELPKETAPLEQPRPTEEAVKPIPDYSTFRTQTQKLIASRYTFTEDEASRLATEPEKVLPEVIGRVFVDVYEALFYSLANQLPKVVNGTINLRNDVQSREQTFYNAFPDLNKPEYSAKLGAIAKAYRELNPDAKGDQLIQGVGQTARAVLGVQPPPAAPEAKQPTAPKPKMPSVPAAARTGPGPNEPQLSEQERSILDTLNFELDDN